MKIKEILWQHRYDFDAQLECEFCGSERALKGGYNDANFHSNVLTKINCQQCGKDSYGNLKKSKEH